MARNDTIVRNPLLALPAMQELMALPADQRLLLARLMGQLHITAATKAETSWRSHKAPMAAYWKAVSVYAGHTSRALKRGA